MSKYDSEQNPIEAIKAVIAYIVINLLSGAIAGTIDYIFFTYPARGGLTFGICIFSLIVNIFLFYHYYYYLVNKKYETKDKADEFYKKYGKLNIEEALDFYKEYEHQIKK